MFGVDLAGDIAGMIAGQVGVPPNAFRSRRGACEGLGRRRDGGRGDRTRARGSMGIRPGGARRDLRARGGRDRRAREPVAGDGRRRSPRRRVDHRAQPRRVQHRHRRSRRPAHRHPSRNGAGPAHVAATTERRRGLPGGPSRRRSRRAVPDRLLGLRVPDADPASGPGARRCRWPHVSVRILLGCNTDRRGPYRRDPRRVRHPRLTVRCPALRDATPAASRRALRRHGAGMAVVRRERRSGLAAVRRNGPTHPRLRRRVDGRALSRAGVAGDLGGPRSSSRSRCARPVSE